MRIISTGYSKSPSFTDPYSWLRRIGFYTGILEELALTNEVSSIERISYEGVVVLNGVHYVFIEQEKRVVYFPFSMHALLSEMKPDVVLVNGFIFPLQILQLRRKIGRKAMILVLNRAEKPGKGIKKWLQKMADKVVNAYLFASAEDGLKWKETGIIKEEKKIREVMQASSVFHLQDREKARQKTGVYGQPVFLWAGRLDENKDPVTALKAFIAYAKENPQARLYMIFQEEKLLNTIKLLIASSGEGKKIILKGRVEHAEMGNWYNAADFFISTSHSEGSGIAAIEAMSCGCIPLLTRIPSFKKMTDDGDCGFLFEKGNHEELLSVFNKTKEINWEQERTKVMEKFNRDLSFSAIARKINSIIAEK